VLTALVPAAVGAAVTQINLLLDRLMAGWVGPQAPAALYFSERLVYLPLGVFAVAAGQVLLPSLSRLAARQENERIRETVALSVSMMAFLMLPAAAGLAALAFPITQTLYGFGAFDAESVFHTATALAAYAPALFMFSLDKVFVPVFLAHHDSRTPLFAGLASVGLNLLLNLGCLIWAPDRWKHAMIALTTVIAHAVYIATLARRTHRLCGDCGWVRQISALLRCGAASTLMAACAWSVQRWIAGLAGPGKAGQVVATLLAVLAGMAVYAMVAAVFRFPEWRSLTGRLKKSGAG
jgi:putative peptidoglycan lipid II flippase